MLCVVKVFWLFKYKNIRPLHWSEKKTINYNSFSMQVVKSHIWRNKGLVAYLFKIFRKQIDGILKTDRVNLGKYPQFSRNNVNTHFICSNFSLLFVDLYDTITVLIMWKWISVRMSWSFSSRNVDAYPVYTIFKLPTENNIQFLHQSMYTQYSKIQIREPRNDQWKTKKLEVLARPAKVHLTHGQLCFNETSLL